MRIVGTGAMLSAEQCGREFGPASAQSCNQVYGRL